MTPMDRNFGCGTSATGVEAVVGDSRVLWTANKNLAYLRSGHRLNSQQACRVLFLGRFNYTLPYQPSSKSVMTDIFSRQFSPLMAQQDQPIWRNALPTDSSFYQQQGHQYSSGDTHPSTLPPDPPTCHGSNTPTTSRKLRWQCPPYMFTSTMFVRSGRKPGRPSPGQCPHPADYQLSPDPCTGQVDQRSGYQHVIFLCRWSPISWLHPHWYIGPYEIDKIINPSLSLRPVSTRLQNHPVLIQ
ncbi:hypothetical protein L3Q82_019580, partial [Scortum barcoo]